MRVAVQTIILFLCWLPSLPATAGMSIIPPPGDWIDVAAGADTFCGLSNKGVAWCFQDGELVEIDDGYVTIDGDVGRMCGSKRTGGIQCWTRSGPRYDPLLPEFTEIDQVAAGRGWSEAEFAVCGRGRDGTMRCQRGEVPGGIELTQMDVATHHACGVRTDGSLHCWGSCVYSKASGDLALCDAPSGSFRQVATTDQASCAIRTDGTVVCWGDEEIGAPEGQFAKITAGDSEFCGVDPDGGLTCWDDRVGGCGEPRSLSDTRFLVVETLDNMRVKVGITVDGRLVAWGNVDYVQPASDDADEVVVAPDPGVDPGSVSSAHGLGVGDPIILGALAKEEIDRTILRHLEQLRGCFDQAVEADPPLSGKIVIKFVVAKDGTVASAKVNSTSLDSPDIGPCICHRFMYLKFPQPKGGGIVIVSYPFVFTATPP